MPPENSYYPFSSSQQSVQAPSGNPDYFNQSEGTPNINNIPQLISASSLSGDNSPGQSFSNSVAQAMAADTLSPTNLLPGQKILDPTTQALITQYGQNAQNAGSNYAPQLLSGTGEAQRFLPGAVQNPDGSFSVGSTPSESENGMSMPSDLETALNQRAQQQFQSNLGGLSANLNFQAPMQQESQEATYNNLLNANEQIQNSNYQQQVQYQNQQLALYNQWQMSIGSAGAGVLGAVIGAGGQVGGAASGAALAGGGLAGGATASGAAAGVSAGDLIGLGAAAAA